MTHTVSLGMFVAAAAYLIFRLAKWLSSTSKGSRNWKSLAPLASGIFLMMCASACTGGVIGWALHLGALGEGQVGNFALTAGTGAHSVNAQTASTFGALTQWGAAVVVLLVAALVGAWKYVAKHVRKDLGGGAWVGIGLGPLIGGYTLIPLINSVGLSLIAKPLFHA